MREFESFLNEKDVKKKGKDEARARSLSEEAEKRKKFVERISLSDEDANYIIENIYDVIRQLIEAKLSLEGYKSYSHEATVSYLKKLDFSDNQIRFLDELRKIRNGIKYYGNKSDKEYTKKALDFMKEVYIELKNIVEKGLKEDR